MFSDFRSSCPIGSQTALESEEVLGGVRRNFLFLNKAELDSRKMEDKSEGSFGLSQS